MYDIDVQEQSLYNSRFEILQTETRQYAFYTWNMKSTYNALLLNFVIILT
jgi:hypothetical protein